MATLHLRGAREHNLAGVDLDLPRERLIVFTGVSGSGKSSLAFATLFAESQRRFIEALAPHARGRFGALHKPAFDHLDGLVPALGLSQRGVASPSARSTVGTLTELADLLRIAWSRMGRMRCPRCASDVDVASFDQIVRAVLAMPEGARLTVAAPVARGRVGPLAGLAAEIGRQGFTRIRVDGVPWAVDEPIPADPRVPHDVDVVVDRIRAGPDKRDRVQDAIGTALKAGDGAVVVIEEEAVHTWSTGGRCVRCALPLPPNTPRLYSFNAPTGACPGCDGLGLVDAVDEGAVVVDPERSLREGALEGGRRLLEEAEARGVGLDAPWRTLPWEERDRVLHGDGEWSGAIGWARERIRSGRASDRLRRRVSSEPCRDCGGARLGPVAREVRVADTTLPGLLALPLGDARAFVARLAPPPELAGLHEELLHRLDVLLRSGLGHLSLDRGAATLSAGELQRVRLGAQVGNQLSGVLYVLDEPTAGLHPADTAALVELLRGLRDAGNTVLAVEHDPAVIEAADLVVDFGPGAGAAGGRVVFQGPPEALRQADTETGRWLAGRGELPAPRPVGTAWIRLRGARGHNLQGVELAVPLRALVGVTGVSGAGKSSLVFDTLGAALAARLDGTRDAALPYEAIEGADAVRRLQRVDGTGFGSSTRANVATAARFWDDVRELYARTPEARLRGFGPERFSFNLPGGRCEACKGEGARTVDLHLLPSVTLPCEVCDGKRFDEATLAVTWRGASIADLLALPVRAARPLFAHQSGIAGALATLDELGLGYLPLGQPADTWSGGEAQRVRLARELARPGEIDGTLYLLDEPSVGLHPADVAVLARALRRLADAGGTVVIVEHDPVFLRACDWLVELGPGAGAAGGRVVAEGPPAALAAHPHSPTGPWLREPG